MKGTFRDLIDKLRVRKKQYQSAFSEGAPAHEALLDLAKYCRAFEPEIIYQTPLAAERAAGRREAFFRVYQHLHLEPHELVALYRAAVIPQQEQQQ